MEFEIKDTHPCIGKLIIPDKTGTIVGQKILKESSDVTISLDYDPGEHVRRFAVGPDRIGQIVAKGYDFDVKDYVQIDIEED